jgi:ABC-2 type transport system permease protein
MERGVTFRLMVAHEWRLLRRSRAVLVLIAVFAPVVGGSIITVARSTKLAAAAERALAAEETGRFQQYERQAAAIERAAAERGLPTPPFEAEAPKWGVIGPRHALYLWAWNAPRFSPPPSPYLPLAIGQWDLQPSTYKVGLDMPLEWQPRGRVVQQLDNPWLLKSGRFDLAFVTLILFPLLILALTFDAISADRESGTLALLAASGVSLRRVVMVRIGCRFVMAATTLMVPAIVTLGWSGVPLDVRVLAWALVATAYGAWWALLALCLGTSHRSSAGNALVFSGVWFVLVFVIPASLQLAVDAWYPTLSRLDYINRWRVEEDDIRRERATVVSRWLVEHPEIAQFGWTTANLGVGFPHVPEFMPMYIEALELRRRIGPVIAAHEHQLDRRTTWVRYASWTTPTVIAQSAFYDLAGSGAARHQAFLAQLNAFNDEWRSFFIPTAFQRQMINASDFSRMPRFQFLEEPTSAVVTRVARCAGQLAALIVLLLAFGARASRFDSPIVLRR